jgi:hypothetical protein
LTEPALSQQPTDEMGQFVTPLTDTVLGPARVYRAFGYLLTHLSVLVHNNTLKTKRKAG